MEFENYTEPKAEIVTIPDFVTIPRHEYDELIRMKERTEAAIRMLEATKYDSTFIAYFKALHGFEGVKDE